MMVNSQFIRKSFIFVVDYLILFLILKFGYGILMSYTFSYEVQLTLEFIGSILGLPLSTSLSKGNVIYRIKFDPLFIVVIIYSYIQYHIYNSWIF